MSIVPLEVKFLVCDLIFCSLLHSLSAQTRALICRCSSYCSIIAKTSRQHNYCLKCVAEMSLPKSVLSVEQHTEALPPARPFPADRVGITAVSRGVTRLHRAAPAHRALWLERAMASQSRGCQTPSYIHRRGTGSRPSHGGHYYYPGNSRINGTY